MDTIGVEGFSGRLAIGWRGDRGVTVDRYGRRKSRHRRGSESWRSARTFSRNIDHEYTERTANAPNVLLSGCHVPEEGVMEAIGVAMMLLGLRAANCCICTAATVATGDRYADWATNACCWTSWEKKQKKLSFVKDINIIKVRVIAIETNGEKRNLRYGRPTEVSIWKLINMKTSVFKHNFIETKWYRLRHFECCF